MSSKHVKKMAAHMGYVLFFCLLLMNVLMLAVWREAKPNDVKHPGLYCVIDSDDVVVPLVYGKLPSIELRSPSDTRRWDHTFRDVFETPDPISNLLGPDNVTFPDKYVIYRCDNETLSYCGGWADRVRGMFTAYILANLTGRVFKAEIVMPECDIRQFIVPNHVPWSLAMSFHDVVQNGPDVKMWDMWGNLTLYDDYFRNTDFVNHPVMDSDFFYMKANHDNMDHFRESKVHGKVLAWMHDLDRVSINRFLFKRLFKPSRYLQHKVSTFLARHVAPREKLVCAHLRMGKNPTIPKETRSKVPFRHLQVVWDFLEQQTSFDPENSKIFLMSDARRVIEEAKCQPFRDKLFFSPGQIVHIELTKSITNRQKCDGLEKVLFEQLVLLHCDVMLVSDSGLSRMAAYVRGSDDNLYCFMSHGVIRPCDMLQIKTLYNTRG